MYDGWVGGCMIRVLCGFTFSVFVLVFSTMSESRAVTGMCEAAAASACRSS